jgi:CRISPR-associated protein Csm2
MTDAKEKMKIPKDDLEKIISKGDTKLMVEKAEKFGSYLAEKSIGHNSRPIHGSNLTTSQIRNFFGTVKKIEARGFNASGSEREFLLLKPKLAYAAQRDKGSKLKDMKDVMIDAIDIVTSGDGDKEEKFNNFCDFFEAILCYHKAQGGR